MDRKSPSELQDHMLSTYFGLRVGLAVIGIALPLVVLFAGGVLHHVWLEPSISDYYHTPDRLFFFTTRDLFVGGLFAAGACLYLYKGFGTRENVALNLAGIFALFVALLPTSAPGADRGLISILHGTSAVLFFLCISYVSLFRSRDTFFLLAPERRPTYARLYTITGIALLVSPLLAVAFSFGLEPASRFRTLIFWLETFGVWAFAAYWIVKTSEMRRSHAERRGLDGELKREVVPPVPPDEPAAPATERAPGAVPPASPGSARTVEKIVPRAWP